MTNDEDEIQIASLTVLPPELDELDTKLQSRHPALLEFYWPNERVLVDVTTTIAGIEGGGLYGFWSADLNQKRIIQSFRKVGATKVSELLEESRWANPLIRNGDYDRRKEEFGPERFNEFSRLESDLLRALKEAPPLALEFARARRITGAPLTVVGKIVGVLTLPLRLFMN